nr:MAG TPA: hypothetical protein [Caudoviricetes sp.]
MLHDLFWTVRFLQFDLLIFSQSNLYHQLMRL